jgi:aryl-alcohol dehydrogenase-like predicted oxidoreductase
MWKTDQLTRAAEVASAAGLAAPCAFQEAYNVVWRSPVGDEDMNEALEAASASVVGSAALAFGALSGKYAQAGAEGRISEDLDNPAFASALAAAGPLAALAERLDTTPAALAIAFSLSNPRVASALFGATRPEQIAENARAVELLDRLSDSDLTELRRIQ